MSLVTIKQAIKVKLDELVTDNVLEGATITDIRKDPLAADHPNSPHAYLMPPAIESEVLDNRTNIRTYTFSIMVVFNALNITGTTDLEERVEAILNKLDNDPTMNGTAQAGVSPTSSAPVPLQHGDKDLIVVIVEVQARDTVSLSFV